MKISEVFLMISKTYGLLGISAKAGKLVSGTDLVLEEMNKARIYLVIIAEDASEKTKKNIVYYCDKNNVKHIFFGTIDELSKSIGKNNKAIIGVKDQNLAKAIIDKIN